MSPRALPVLFAVLALATLPPTAPAENVAVGTRVAPGLGTFEPAAVAPAGCFGPPAVPGVPAGVEAACLAFVIRDCPGVAGDLMGQLAVTPPPGAWRGTLLFVGGGEGTHWWGGQAGAPEVFERLREEGFTLVQQRWASAWALAEEGDPAGLANLACRPATVMAWVHDHLHAPLDLLGGAVGECGFCVVGWSNGANQVSYALSHHHLEGRLDALVPTAGPGKAAIVDWCLPGPGEDPSNLEASRAHAVDFSYGIRTFDGPCFRHDPALEPAWVRDGVATGGSDYAHPATRVHFLFGANDDGDGPLGGALYAQRLQQEENDVTVEVVPGTPHSIVATPQGRAALLGALLGEA